MSADAGSRSLDDAEAYAQATASEHDDDQPGISDLADEMSEAEVREWKRRHLARLAGSTR